MHVDIEGTTRIARLAAEFDWTWAVDDLEPFCAQAGWEIVELRQGGASIRTNLHVSRPEAHMFGRQHRMNWISIFVTDLADDATPMTVVRPLLDEGFTNLDVALTALLGTANERRARTNGSSPVGPAQSGRRTQYEPQRDPPATDESRISGMGG